MLKIIKLSDDDVFVPNIYPKNNMAEFQRALDIKIMDINQRKSIFAIPAGMDIYCPNPKVKGAKNTEVLP